MGLSEDPLDMDFEQHMQNRVSGVFAAEMFPEPEPQETFKATGVDDQGLTHSLPLPELVATLGVRLVQLEITGEAAAHITEAQLFGALSEATGLHKVWIQHCDAMSDRVARKLGTACSQLMECRLEWCGLKNNAVIGLVSGPAASKLEVISLRGNGALSDGSMMAIARNCRILREVDARGLPSLSDRGVEKLVSACSDTIDSLWLGECPLLTSLTALENCTNLRLINLDNCPKIDHAALVISLQHWSSLSELSILGRTVCESERQEIMEAAPNLQRLIDDEFQG